MRHLSNIPDPRIPRTKEYFTCYTYYEWCNGPSAIEAAWERHLEWVNSNVIGRPKATEKYTVEELENMGMIGIYARES